MLVEEGVLEVAEDTGQPVPTTTVASSGDPAQPQSLGEIPGFRRSPEGSEADDTIVLWEAFSRETYVQNCMSQEGLDYHIDIASPWGARLAVTESIPVSESDRYFMTLYGESAADVAAVKSTGFLPEGRNDFAQGGCVGASWDAIPRLYELRDELSDEVKEAKATEMAEAVPCVTPSGVRLANLADLETTLDAAFAAAFESGESTSDVLQDMESCEAALETENAAAGDRARTTVFARHKPRLLRQEELYGSIVDDLIEPDEQFSQYLQGTVILPQDDVNTQSP